MAQGRCAGCGRTGSACKVNDHTAECSQWLALYAAEPAKALDAAAEYIRYRDSGARDDERAERREAVATAGEAARTASVQRFAFKDILED